MLDIPFATGVVLAIVLLIRQRATVAKGQTSNAAFTTGEKWLAGISLFIAPVIAQAVLYYGLRKRLPVKAAWANKAGWLSFLFWILVGVVFVFIIAGSTTAP